MLLPSLSPEKRKKKKTSPVLQATNRAEFPSPGNAPLSENDRPKPHSVTLQQQQRYVLFISGSELSLSTLEPKMVYDE